MSTETLNASDSRGTVVEVNMGKFGVIRGRAQMRKRTDGSVEPYVIQTIGAGEDEREVMAWGIGKEDRVKVDLGSLLGTVEGPLALDPESKRPFVVVGGIQYGITAPVLEG